MRDSFVMKLVSVVMMLLTPAVLLMAETNSTMLYAKGSVLLNGIDVARSAAVSAGDRIETAGSSAVTVDQNGSKVTVNRYSAVRYESDSVRVLRGGANVETGNGMAARVAQISVTPKTNQASYEIARLDNKITITSHAGALMVSDAGTTSTLEPGASSTLNADPQATTPAPAPQAAPAQNTGGGDVGYGKLFAIGAVVAAGAVACGLWCGTSASSLAPGNQSTKGSNNMHMARHMTALQRVATVAASHPAISRAVAATARSTVRSSVRANAPVTANRAAMAHHPLR